MSKVFNTLQARYDNAMPDEVPPNVQLHEDITQELGEVYNLLFNLKSSIDRIHKLAEGTQYEDKLSYLMYQLDTDTAQYEIEEF